MLIAIYKAIWRPPHVDKCWTKCRDVTKKATEKVVGTKQMVIRNEWFHDECAHATAVKKRAYLIMQQRH